MKRNKLAIWLTTMLAGLGGIQHAAAQTTTSAVRGNITEEDGDAIPNATVTIVYEPTGGEVQISTSASGAFFAPGLRVGGPYDIRIQAPGYEERVVEDLYLGAGQIESFTAALQSETTEVLISGASKSRLSLNNGVGSKYTAGALQDQPSVNRDLTDTLLRDPLVSGPGGSNFGNFRIGGFNPKLNALSIDGVMTKDDFGLSNSVYPSIRAPLSLDTIQEASIVASDYSAESSGFQGGLVNIVTKSGGSKFHGNLYRYEADENLRGSRIGSKIVRPVPFKEVEYGGTLGGPIIKDKLFFFVGYEDYGTGTPGSFAGTDATNGIVDPTFFEDVADIIDTSLGYRPTPRPSVFASPTVSTRWMGKLDLHAGERQRFTLSYNKVDEGREISNSLGFKDAWYQTPTLSEAMALEVNSQWTDNLSSTFRVSQKDLGKGQLCNAGAVGEIKLLWSGADVAGNPTLAPKFTGPELSGEALVAGCDRFRHDNKFEDRRRQMSGRANYIVGDHVVSGGAQWDEYSLINIFLNNSLGVFEFNNLTALETATASRVQLSGVPGNSDPSAKAAAWEVEKLGFWAQDTWRLSPDLSFNAGLRYEVFKQDDTPQLRTDYVARYGESNQVNLDGRDILMPRAGFQWDVLDRTRVTGGFGLFAGGEPGVWVSNAFSPKQVTVSVNNYAGADPRVIPQTLIDQIAASDGTTSATIDTINPNFKIPSQWKASLRVDQRFDLKFGDFNLGSDWLFTAQYLYSKTKDGFRWVNLPQIEDTLIGPDLSPGVAPDGRPIYANLHNIAVNTDGTNANDIDNVFELRNADGGEGHTFTVALQKAFDNGLDFGVSYAYSNVDSVVAANSSRAVSNFKGTFDSDRNNPGVARADYEQEQKIGVNFGFEKEFFGDLESRFDLTGVFTSGEPWSYVFTTTRDNALFGASRNESPFATDLLYIPQVTGGVFNDPRVVFGAGFNQAAFLNIINNRGLPTGQIIDRHSDSATWNQLWDFKYQQDLPFANFGRNEWSDNKLKLVVDVKNFGNLLNDDWGRTSQGLNNLASSLITADLVSFAASDTDLSGTLSPGEIAAATALVGDAPRTTCVTETSCLYRYNSLTTAQTATSRADDTNSVFSVRVGLRYEF